MPINLPDHSLSGLIDIVKIPIHGVKAHVAANKLNASEWMEKYLKLYNYQFC